MYRRNLTFCGRESGSSARGFSAAADVSSTAPRDTISVTNNYKRIMKKRRERTAILRGNDIGGKVELLDEESSKLATADVLVVGHAAMNVANIKCRSRFIQHLHGRSSDNRNDREEKEDRTLQRLRLRARAAR